MTAALAIVWLAAAPPDGAEARALNGWSRAHGAALVPPPDEGPPALPVDPRDTSTALAVDELLDRARDAIAERDGGGADVAIDAADRALRLHPELANAAWLMAEVERARALRLRRVPPFDPEGADRAWERAEALDGGRAAGAGEEAAAPQARVSTVVFPDLPGEEMWLDGIEAGPGAVTTGEGLHAATVTWKGAPIWAGWINVAAAAPPVVLALPAPPVPACSASDLGGVRAREGAVLVPRTVRCERWVAATTGLVPGAIRLATCTESACSDLLDWSLPPAWGPAEHRPRSWPAWGTWAVVGAGVAVAAGMVAAAVVASSASPGASETRWVGGGLRSP